MDWTDRMEELIHDHIEYQKIVFNVCDVPNPKYTALILWYDAIAKHFYCHALEDIKTGKINIDSVVL